MSDLAFKKFALIIPTLNEAGNIRQALGRACAALASTPYEWEVVVVDDGSTDGTDRLVREYAHSCVRLVQRQGERGLSGAITFGWSQTDADLLGVMDADLQHPPELLPILINESVSGVDVVIASRYLRPGSMDGWNPIRKLLSRASVLASKPVQRRTIRVTDPLSGFFVVQRKSIQGMQFQKTGFKLLLEILATAPITRVKEVPFKFAVRARDKSKANWATGAYYAALLLKLIRKPAKSPNTETTKETAARGSRSLQIILGLLPLVLGFQLIIWIAYLPTALLGQADFRNCYTGGLMVRTGQGHKMYDYALQKQLEDQYISPAPLLLPWVHLPYEAALFAPLSFLKYRTAYVAWLGVNFVLVMLSWCFLSKKLSLLQREWRVFPALFVLGFAPVMSAMMQGQDSLLTLLLFSLALVYVGADQETWAGALVGLALYKFQLVLPIAFFFFVWRRWRFVRGIAVTSVLCLLFSAGICGWSQLIGYFHSLRQISTSFNAGNQVLYQMPVARMPNIRGLVTAIPHLTDTASFFLVLGISAVVCGAAIRVGWHAPVQWKFAIAISATTLVGYHVLMHDLAILLIPIAFLLEASARQGLWAIPIIWIAPLLCFLGYDHIAAVAALTFFAALLSRTVTSKGVVSPSFSVHARSA